MSSKDTHSALARRHPDPILCVERTTTSSDLRLRITKEWTIDRRRSSSEDYNDYDIHSHRKEGNLLELAIKDQHRNSTSVQGMLKATDKNKCPPTPPNSIQHGVVMTFSKGKFNFKCRPCNKEYTKESRYLAHMCRHSGSLPFACSQCPMAFPSKKKLKRHYKMCEAEKSFEVESPEKDVDVVVPNVLGEKLDSGVKDFSPECPELNPLLHPTTSKGTTPAKIYLHTRSRTRRLLSSLDEAKDESFGPTLKDEGKILVLPKVTTDRSTLNTQDNRKLEEHTNYRGVISRRAFLCMICLNEYASELTLNGHMISHHKAKEWAFKCPFCDQRFHAEKPLFVHSRKCLENPKSNYNSSTTGSVSEQRTMFNRADHPGQVQW